MFWLFAVLVVAGDVHLEERATFPTMEECEAAARAMVASGELRNWACGGADYLGGEAA